MCDVGMDYHYCMSGGSVTGVKCFVFHRHHRFLLSFEVLPVYHYLHLPLPDTLHLEVEPLEREENPTWQSLDSVYNLCIFWTELSSFFGGGLRVLNLYIYISRY